MKSSNRKCKRAQPLLGTYVEIELQGKTDESCLNSWITQGFKVIADIDRLMSRHRSGSDLSRLNCAAPGLWVTLDPHTVNVLRAANQFWRDSKGIFDFRCNSITPYPRLSLWSALPSPLKGERVGVRGPITTRGNRVKKSGPWIFDLDGIAKGYAVDCAVKRIQKASSGFKLGGIVNAGGDLRVWGDRPVPSGTLIRGRRVWAASFEIRNTAAASSAVRSESTSNQTLSPAVHRRGPGHSPRIDAPVTVFADRCMMADALTKIVMLGPKALAARCLAAYHAQALIFSPNGNLAEAMG